MKRQHRRSRAAALARDCAVIFGRRAASIWRYFMADGNSLRGVNLMRVENGRIVEAMAT
ncbi:hypothetical protein [Mesorhizobium sp.]|uniref:hypothetical protein n=1 Tax=Mesorhizobium sp. TaxID=1871066 RepID=UPI0025E18B5E|nr:hypothetical protein [Mesorhizobium sp.]